MTIKTRIEKLEASQPAPAAPVPTQLRPQLTREKWLEAHSTPEKAANFNLTDWAKENRP